MNLDFSTCLELPYPRLEDYEDTVVSIRLLLLAEKFRTAGAPLSNRYQRFPDLGVWAFAATTSTCHLDPADEMRVVVDYFDDLACALSTPLRWLSAEHHCADRVSTFRSYIEVGLYLNQYFDGQMEATVRHHSFGASTITLDVDGDSLLVARDKLKPPHKPSEMKFELKILNVDLDRSIVYTSMGLLQVEDPSLLIQAYDLIGQWRTVWVDTAASAIRLVLPELIRI